MLKERKKHIFVLIVLTDDCEYSQADQNDMYPFKWCVQIDIRIFSFENTWSQCITFQLLDTLQVCQDFNGHGCARPTCKFLHVREGECDMS